MSSMMSLSDSMPIVRITITMLMSSLHKWHRLPRHPAYVKKTRCITEAFLPHICIWWQRTRREVLCNQENRMAGLQKGIRAQITRSPWRQAML